ncbi:MAG: PTS sugar transporter subunit IIB [Endomicrobiales bacterium]|jgi:PTS system mannose-specific IIB component
MPIILTRIDDRLIHGQVVEGWVKAISINHIIVISDEVANDKMQQALLSMAVPNTINVTVLSIDAAVTALKSTLYAKDNLLLLLSKPADVVRLLDQGVALTSVNLGGMHYAQGKTQLLRNLSVNDADLDALFAISAKGVELEGRILPRDERVNVIEILRKKFNR